MLDETYAEPHYSVGALGKLWSVSRETARLLVKDEPGVVKIQLGRGKKHVHYSVPASVARRIHTRLAA